MATVRGVYKKDLCVKDNWHLFIAMMPSEVSGKMVETKCSGVFSSIYEGQPFTFVGEFESYKGCKTFRVKSYSAEMPKGMEESMAFIRSIKGIMQYANITSACFVRRCLKELQKEQLVYTVKGLRSKGIPNTYKISKFSLNKGFFSVEYLVLKDYLGLFYTEMALMLVLRKLCACKTDVVVNQSILGKMIGGSRTNTSELMKKLEMRGYITMEQRFMDKVRYQYVVDVRK